ncbi:TSUP family transporter [Hyphomicrobium sp.]|uniref:TSUP family transporter n=1 Tax=Hyphomicrobium sp. TaxID=82 RepID=UPI0025B7A802|nr:TSUP family transporter [Hyphomicrobium sp.]MCC7250699.1 TSUP family transporter [Hyphomicrobium sp.]
MELEIIGLLVAVAVCAGFVDAIAGGGGLLTLPALMMAGVPPVQAIATNKLQGTFGVAASSFAFWRAGHIDVPSLVPAVVAAALGAGLGSLAVQAVDPQGLRQVVPAVLLLVAAYFALAPYIRDTARSVRLGPRSFALAVAAPIGAYDGFLGPGAGSMYLIGFVALFGSDLVKGVAGTKLLNLTSNVVALAVFAAAGHVDYAIGLAMAVGQIVGARAGARAAIARGAPLIRPLVIIVSIAIAASLLLRG